MFKNMIAKSVMAAGIVLSPVAAFAQATLTAETTTPGSTPHYIDTTLAAVLESAGVATLQITEGATLTNSVQAVAEGQLDMAPAPLILPFLLSKGIGPYSGIGAEKGAELAGGLRAIFFTAASAQIFGHYNSGAITDIRNLEGMRIWNGPPRGAALNSGRATVQLLSGLKDNGEGYESVQSPWPDTVSTITGGGADGWTIPEGLPSGRQIALAAAGATTIYDIPSDLLNSELGQQIASAPGHAPYSIPVEEYRAAYAGNDITIVTDDDTFDSYATAFAQIVPASLDEELVYKITAAYLAGQERFETGSPRGPYLFMSFGDLDGTSQGVCGAVQLPLHAGAVRAYEDAGHTVADCLRP
ncbi:TAXI family TRAP transporter solute-binding subunit [Sulfitobacter donghicola]|uniref:C4-dicarboxylate ABC transporter substrate-binding protein n=1 Tax=Sulfitobacter donghicola DSW-25 = KCTC 12864 = JCM 14565 TaxID=1300350 RepID=A0A073IK00_9RHOB|nr:TAXI family TRAP transporter solute-binding subunit [Sulfitobacter donghicola]KEJ90054.1 C4-dicarboxylate ABC transporter substrate-binding protein [Sulfitobacter donghicola DSW-25 = KCTC 12864 = JCM 14565]KIN66803.1 TRAP-type transporter, periplasmic component [Sulfitobacter donghicola DSW-25 = KCTC 12864 = JCM 14565]